MLEASTARIQAKMVGNNWKAKALGKKETMTSVHVERHDPRQLSFSHVQKKTLAAASDGVGPSA
jgi:hypothetical protein